MRFIIYRHRSCLLSMELGTAKSYVGGGCTLLSLLLCYAGGGSLSAKLVIGTAMAMLTLLRLDCDVKTAEVLGTLWCAAVPPLILVTTQLLMGADLSQISPWKIFLGVLIAGIVVQTAYLLCRDRRASVVCSTVLLMGLTVGNYFVLKFRGSELVPSDLFAMETAMEVAGNYKYSFDAPFSYACCFAIAFCMCGFCIPAGVPKRGLLRFARGLAVDAVMVLILLIGLQDVPVYHFYMSGTTQNGYLLHFVSRYEPAAEAQVPDGYSLQAIRELEQKYSDGTGAVTKMPDIIIIMNETFSDLSVLGQLSTDKEVLPFFQSLKAESIHGYALSPVFGGGTCNAEYEALTGNAMAFFPGGTYPYQQYLNADTFSIASHLKNIGYQTMATHPNIGENWMRSKIWPLLGFDSTRFLEDYPQENLIRGHVSDQEMYEQIIAWYAEQSTAGPCLFFGVTMQNHSPYDYSGEDFSTQIHLHGMQNRYPEAEQYLTLLHASDMALEYLLSRLEDVERPVVLVFFGDHQARLDREFYNQVHGSSFDTLDAQMLQYAVPFFVWANFEIDARDVGLTSLNFLSNYVYEAAGLPLPAYNAFLKDVQSVIPAMNSLGFYSNAAGGFVSYDQAEGEAAAVLQQYRMLQYNSLFDPENCSQVFFRKGKRG